MNEEIKTLLCDNIVIDNKVIPVAHLTYKGSSRKFITWAMLEENVGLSANDEVLYSVCSVDIDVFSDGNYLGMVNQIKKIMKNADWVWTGDSPEMYETDTGLYHKTISFEKERNILWQE
jgi:hypothetical protein